MNATRMFLVSALILGFVFAQGVFGQTLKGPTIPEELGITLPPATLIAGKEVTPFRNLAPANLAAMPKTATFTINYLNAGLTNNYGDVSIGWSADAKAAFTYAANVWGTLLNSSVPIVINAAWANLGSGVLGHAGARSFYQNFSGAPQADSWYAVSTANALAGTDLNGSGTEEITAGFNAQFDWYYGTDGNCPSTQYDLVSVVMHEIGHGLGFLGSMSVSSGQGSWGFGSGVPIIYDRFTEDGSGQKLITAYANPSAGLGAALISGNVYFSGANAMAGNGGSKVQLYSPTTWAGGSSYSHLGESFNGTVNALMTYSLNYAEAIHDPGPVTKGLLQDVGWTTATPGPTPPPPVVEGSPVLTDYDGDWYGDLGIFRTDGSWYLACSSAGYVTFPSDAVGSQYMVQPGDFDGDRWSDPSVYDSSSAVWYFMASSYGWSWFYINLPWIEGGTPACGDFDGDRMADPVAYDGSWYILSSRYGWDGHYYKISNWGGSGYSPVLADFDGDRYGDPMAYDTTSGYWYILSSRYGWDGHYYSVWFGVSGFTPLSGDFDGDLYADLTLYEKSSGMWAILLSSTGWQYYIYGIWDGSP